MQIIQFNYQKGFKLTMSVLTPEMITAKLANQKRRGVHPVVITQFINSGELATVVNELPQYRTTDPADFESKVKQGLTVAYKTLKTKNLAAGNSATPDVTVLWDADESQLYLINETALAAAQADNNE